MTWKVPSLSVNSPRPPGAASWTDVIERRLGKRVMLPQPVVITCTYERPGLLRRKGRFDGVLVEASVVAAAIDGAERKDVTPGVLLELSSIDGLTGVAIVRSTRPSARTPGNSWYVIEFAEADDATLRYLISRELADPLLGR
jgi:hypothetical protein